MFIKKKIIFLCPLFDYLREFREKIISILDGIKNYNHINLLETLAQQISLKLEKISNVKKITIEIIKCNILSGNQEVGVTLEKSLKKNN